MHNKAQQLVGAWLSCDRAGHTHPGNNTQTGWPSALPNNRSRVRIWATYRFLTSPPSSLSPVPAMTEAKGHTGQPCPPRPALVGPDFRGARPKRLEGFRGARAFRSPRRLARRRLPIQSRSLVPRPPRPAFVACSTESFRLLVTLAPAFVLQATKLRAGRRREASERGYRLVSEPDPSGSETSYIQRS